MLLEGPLKSGKTTFLIDSFINYINNGISSSEILVLCANSYKRDLFVKKVKQKLEQGSISAIGSFPIYTFSGVVYNTILDNWPIIESILPKENENSKLIIPDLTGLEVTQHILKNIIQQPEFSDYFSKTNLLHQLFRRYRLISENNLSSKEIAEKSKIIQESFAPSAQKALNELKAHTNNIRSFDYLKQINTFLYLLQKNKLNDLNHIKYFMVDDVDEFSYSANVFINYMISQSSEFKLTADKDGTSRRGYLCGYTSGWSNIKSKLKANPKTLQSKSKLAEDAFNTFLNIKSNQKIPLKYFKHLSEIKRTEMLEKATLEIKTLLKNGVKPTEIKVISPLIDENIKFNLKDFFEQNSIKYQFLSGNKKLYDDIYVFSTLIIAQLTSQEWKLKPTVFEIRILLNNLLNIPVNDCKIILDEYKKTGSLTEKASFKDTESTKHYKNLISTINEIKASNCDLYNKIVEIFSKTILPIQSSVIKEESNLENFNMMLKSLNEFLKLKIKLKDSNISLNEKDWLLQVKNTVVSDNPSSAPEIEDDAIIIATPQKIVDFELSSRYQIWLDISSREWVKDDTGPLYNSWVFQKNWNEKKYTPDTHKKLTMEKTAHLLRKLILCANEKILTFSSTLDNSGNENSGNLQEYLIIENNKPTTFQNITPREDQKPVLEYQSGKMGIPAVPGAGKTTIMQALIIELLKKNINPSEILVLTYMESAARNFLERIKKSCPGLKELPHISTIHGLAYKIIQDEDNFTMLGLNEGFSICDDTQRPTIIRSISLKHIQPGEEPENWVKLNSEAISKIKISGVKWEKLEQICKKSCDNHLREFLPIYKEYELTLRERNLIDYDDLLVMAMELLDTYPQVKKHYQNKYQFVIEDEAQDSSALQQKFINTISQKHGNLIRCGDVNQAITTTFTNADVKGFKEFIKNSQKVEMKSSQRCTKDIYELANYLIDWSQKKPYSKNAFYDIKMLPVSGKNPISQEALNFNILNTPAEEQQWVVNEIKKKFQQNPEQTFGILLRNNFQIFKWAQFIEHNGLKVICRTDSIKQKKVFGFILKLFEVIESPWNNILVADLAQKYQENNLIKLELKTIEDLKKQQKPFVTSEVSNQELNKSCLSLLWWDIHYWLENSYIPPEELVIKIGNYYFNNILDKSNAYLLSVLIKRYTNNFSSTENYTSLKLPEIIKHFKSIMNQNKISGVNFFNEEDDKDNSLDGFIQIMTLHKSKGDEFDTVFIPEMSEYSFPTDFETLKIKKSKKNNKELIKKLENITASEPKNINTETKAEIEETLRLIYVGITRAKMNLFMCSSKQIQSKSGKMFNSEPSKLLSHLLNEYLQNKKELTNA